MKVKTEALVSNSEMIKTYKTCREKAEHFGKLFILKNNKLDAVLFSVGAYEKLSLLIEHAEVLQAEELEGAIQVLLGENYTKGLPVGLAKVDIEKF